ncbi:hypothetical protein [Streptomyces sp. Root1310]|nr:hypothetical protein [Streptomyces sp. Root1310]
MGHTGVRVIGFSPDGALLATGGADGTVQPWNTPVLRDPERTAPQALP